MNQDDLQQRINAILANLDEQNATASDWHSYTVIDVYVMDSIDAQTEEALNTVDSTLASEPQECQDSTNEEREPPTASPPTASPPTASPPIATPRVLPRWSILVCIILCIVCIGIGATSYLISFLTPSATITLVTTSQTLTTQENVELVMRGIGDPSKNQIPGRMLPSVTMSQQQTVPTTGTTHQHATAAHGSITFYNGATYTQTIPAGTLLTGADGVQLVTDIDAIIPSALFPTFGQASVSAHAVLPGVEGNVRAGDIYGACCRVNVSAVNATFTGGQDARIYQSVTAQDITTATSSIKTSLDQSLQATIQTQVHESETLLTPLTCTVKTTPDHQVGEAATRVSVTDEETCTGMTYDTQAFTALTTQRATQDAQQRVGQGYITTGIQSHFVTATHRSPNNMTLQVQSVSLWTYPFTQEQQTSIKAMIAGKTTQQATNLLLHIAGIQSVSIDLQHTMTIPTDMTHISMLFLQV